MGILNVILGGLLVGGLARWAVPGPDPMPMWLTVVIGYAGELLGGTVALVIVGFDVSNPTGVQIAAQLSASILAAAVLVVLYRRFVQRRPIVGPGAYSTPTRGIGIDRLRPRGRPTTAMSRQQALERLDELHDQGALTEDEYLERRRRVLRQS